MVKIVVADDEFQARQAIVQLLRKYPDEWTVVGEARNGEETLTSVIEHRPELLITDIRMPVYSGIEVMEKAKRIVPNIQVILLSGFSDFEYAQQAVRQGAFDYLLKPCPYQEILTTVRRAITQKGERGSSEAEAVYTQVISHIILQIHQRYRNELTLKEIAEVMGMNADYLSTVFREEVGETFSNYLARYRIDKAKQLLKELPLKVYEVAEQVGYKRYKYFVKVFKSIVGVTPAEYKKGKSSSELKADETSD
jgi:two-component system response regulator YesN